MALGDADAVSVGDFHLPHLVSHALTGQRRGTDEQMLELLAAWPGHRGRVLRLLTRLRAATPTAAAPAWPSARSPGSDGRRLRGRAASCRRSSTELKHGRGYPTERMGTEPLGRQRTELSRTSRS